MEPRDWITLAALAAVVIGWFVSNSQANRREDRKEGRALIDEAKTLVVEICDNAVKYRCDLQSELATSIKSSLDLLEVELSRTPHFAIKGGPLMAALVDLQEATTGGDFETSSRKAHLPQSSEVAAVYRARNTMLAELERQFRVHYK